MKRFFIDVDTQVDFCHRHGALYVYGAEKILDNCERLVDHAVRTRQLIVGSVDTHAYDAWEFKSNKNVGPNGENPNFPTHCVKGTNGWLKMNDTMVKKCIFIPNVLINSDKDWKNLFSHQDVQAFFFEKEVYSLFANPNANSVLVELLPYSDDEVEYVVFGVATDYCVKAAALGLVEFCKKEKLKFTVKLVTDAIAGVDKKTTKEALEEMEASGIEFVTTDKVLAAK